MSEAEGNGKAGGNGYHPVLVTVATTEDDAQLNRWTLALLALGIPHQVMPAETGWGRLVVVRDVDEGRARHTLTEVDREHAQGLEEQARRRRVERLPRWAILQAELVAFGIIAISTWAGPRTGMGQEELSRAMARGLMDAGAVFAGEHHRLITAVTLHADAAHLLSNVLFFVVMAPTVIHRLGVGVTVLTLVLCGAVGNVVTAAFHGPGFSNVGASGGVFGLCCVLGVLSARMRESRIGANRWLMGAGGVLALLSLLGFGENSDVVAHLAGFFSGAPIGLLAPVRTRSSGVWRWRVWSALTLAVAVGLVGGAWWMALRPQ
ncbi:MAG: rhomboid family intramembrane serine protease [Myxococcota bacterium]